MCHTHYDALQTNYLLYEMVITKQCPLKQLWMKTYLSGKCGGEMNGQLHLSCMVTTSRWIVLLPRAS